MNVKKMLDRLVDIVHITFKDGTSGIFKIDRESIDGNFFLAADVEEDSMNAKRIINFKDISRLEEERINYTYYNEGYKTADIVHIHKDGKNIITIKK